MKSTKNLVSAMVILFCCFVLGFPQQVVLSQSEDQGTSYRLFLPFTMKEYNNSGWLELLHDDFEGSFPGPWVVYSNPIENGGIFNWAQKNCRPAAGAFSAWPIGGGAQGSNYGCTSNYPDYASSWLVAGPFDLTNATSAYLSYKAWFNTEINADYIYGTVSTDGDKFTGRGWSGVSNGWKDEVLDLSNVDDNGLSVLGQPSVYIGFYFVSDGSINYSEGAYIDNVRLKKCTLATCANGADAKISTPQTADQGVAYAQFKLK
jgi:hypothetical protein